MLVTSRHYTAMPDIFEIDLSIASLSRRTQYTALNAAPVICIVLLNVNLNFNMIGSICIQYEVCMLNGLGSYCCPYVPKCTDILIAAVITICIRLWLADIL